MTVGWFNAALVAAVALAAGESSGSAALFFREDWAETPAASPLTQDHVANPDVVLALLGPGAGQLKKSHHDRPADDPYYVWSGEAEATWAVSLARRDAIVDLSVPGARVRWRAKQSGFRQLHLVLRVDASTWLVSEEFDGASEQWREHDFPIRNVRWRGLDIATVVEGKPSTTPDLSRVTAVGFTDLMRGGGTPASSRLDWIEVYGRAVPREGR
jgi:hypothetical protein